MAPLSPVPGTARRVPPALLPLILVLPWVAIVVPSARGGVPTGDGAAALVVVERSITQDQGSWQVDYRLRHEGATAAVATAADVQAKVEGWVSNSRAPSHAVPRLSSLAVVAGSSGWTGTADVITSSDEAQRCRERGVLQLWAGDAPDAPLLAAGKPGESADRTPLLTLTPGAVVRARLRLEHQHFLHGDYDPLLSQRTVELHLGPAVLRDVVPMDREQYLALPRFTWPAPPDDRRDTRHYISAPDSLHLEAHIPGNEHYRFPERPVRYATKMRLRFWYLIANGTEGECRARITQSKETPTAFKILYEAVHEEHLTKFGRWVKVERIFRTEPEATSLTLDFRICDPNDTRIGEMWIDNVSLEPVLAGPAGP